MLIPDVEVVVHEPAALLRQNPVVRIFGGELGNTGPERRPLLHALEDEVDAVAILLLQLLQIRQNEVLFADSLLRPLHRDVLLTGKRLDPLPVLCRALPERLFGDRPNPQNVPEEMHDLSGSRQVLQVAIDHDPVETVVYKDQQAILTGR
jgi:hypothetical protein